MCSWLIASGTFRHDKEKRGRQALGMESLQKALPEPSTKLMSEIGKLSKTRHFILLQTTV